MKKKLLVLSVLSFSVLLNACSFQTGELLENLSTLEEDTSNIDLNNDILIENLTIEDLIVKDLTDLNIVTYTDSRGFTEFHEGLAPVYVDTDDDGFGDTYGFIDVNGEMVVAPIYAEVSFFSEGYAAAGFSDLPDPDSADKYGYIDKNGNMVIDDVYTSAGNFSEGLAPVGLDETGDRTADKYGFINTNGEFVIPPVFDYVEEFYNGVALFGIDIDGDDYGVNGIDKWGFINTSGEIVIEADFLMASGFYTNATLFQKEANSVDLTPVQISTEEGNKYGYINKQGIFVIPPIYERAEVFNDGYAYVESMNEQAFINTSGEIAFTIPSTTTGAIFKDGVAVLSAYSTGDNYENITLCTLLDSSGNEFYASYDTYVLPYYEDIASIFTSRNTFGYLDKEGNILIGDNFKFANTFNEGLTIVHENNGRVLLIRSPYN